MFGFLTKRDPAADQRRADAKRVYAKLAKLKQVRDSLAEKLRDVQADVKAGKLPSQAQVVAEGEFNVAAQAVSRAQEARQVLIDTCPDAGLVKRAASLRRAKKPRCEAIENARQAVDDANAAITRLEQVIAGQRAHIGSRFAEALPAQIRELESRLQDARALLVDTQESLDRELELQKSEQRELAEVYEAMIAI